LPTRNSPYRRRDRPPSGSFSWKEKGSRRGEKKQGDLTILLFNLKEKGKKGCFLTKKGDLRLWIWGIQGQGGRQKEGGCKGRETIRIGGGGYRKKLAFQQGGKEGNAPFEEKSNATKDRSGKDPLRRKTKVNFIKKQGGNGFAAIFVEIEAPGKGKGERETHFFKESPKRGL